MDKIEQKIEGNNNIINNGNIIVNQSRKTVKQKYPEGCIGFDSIKANYIGYLISRYNEYKSYEIGKNNMKYALFSSQLKKAYKIPPTRTIYNLPIERFDDLCSHVKGRIDKTVLAKKLGKQHKNYSTFEEYMDNQLGL